MERRVDFTSGAGAFWQNPPYEAPASAGRVQAAPMTRIRHEITTRRVVFQLAEEAAVQVDRAIRYAPSLVMDLYHPLQRGQQEGVPAVVFVNGYSDLRAQATLGCRIMEMASFESWARMTAVSGMVAITYSTDDEPSSNLHAVMQ
jgi:hypothetical protein